MSSFKEGQVHQLVEAMEGAGFTPEHLTRLGQDPNLLRRLIGVLCGTHQINVVEPRLICVDRSVPFDPVAFLGKGWSIAEEDERSLALTEVDVAQVTLVTMLKDGESRVVGEEKLRRLKDAGHVRLDAGVFKFLWENQEIIPEEWKRTGNGSIQYIYFDGTVLRGPDGGRRVLCLSRYGDEWDWHYGWLGIGWDADEPSAVLAS